jgi:hypothetical protein
MQIPREFKQLCRGFHQDLDLVVNSMDDIAREALLFIERQDVPVVKGFLDELLSGRLDAQELQEIWHSSPADIYFPNAEDLLMVLRHVRAAIDTHPNLTALEKQPSTPDKKE